MANSPTEIQELYLGLKIKDKLIEHLSVASKANMYIIVISPSEWHRIFKTDRCKKLKLIK